MAPSHLEIHVHLSNGNVHRFAQNDPKHIEALLDRLKGRVFNHPTLTFFDANQAVTYPGSALSGLSLILDPLPEALQKLTEIPAWGVRGIAEISESEYQTLGSRSEHHAEGEEFLSLQAIEMVSGYRFYIAVDVERAVAALQERQMIAHAFEGPELVYRRRGGGLCIWNRAHMVSQHFSPCPDMPPTAIPAGFVGLDGYG